MTVESSVVETPRNSDQDFIKDKVKDKVSIQKF